MRRIAGDQLLQCISLTNRRNVLPHFPPPPEIPAKTGLFRRVPPAIFPVVLGLLGLGVAWRRAVVEFGLPGSPLEMFLGMVTLFFAFCGIAYCAKAFFRPGSVIEDMATLPGRTGLSAFAMCSMVEASVLAPYSTSIAKFLLLFGFVGLVAIALPVLVKRIAGKDTSGPSTPAMHLVFVGFIVIPGAAVPLGFPPTLLNWLVWYCVFASLVVVGFTFAPIILGTGTPPLRPLHAIHLAPASLVASSAFLIGQKELAAVALVWSSLIFLLLLFRTNWMTAGGFSGFWSAFTFPVSAYAAALLFAGDDYDSALIRSVGGVVLVLSTLITLQVGYRVTKLWATGALAAKTNASIA